MACMRFTPVELKSYTTGTLIEWRGDGDDWYPGEVVDGKVYDEACGTQHMWIRTEPGSAEQIHRTPETMRLTAPNTCETKQGQVS